MTSMIRPIIPRLPNFYEITASNRIAFIVTSTLMLISVVLVALLVGRFAAGKYDGNKKKTALCFIGISAFVTILLLCFFGCAATTVKGIILSLILVFSSYEDIKKRECEDYLHLMVVIAAFIGTELSSLPNMIMSARASLIKYPYKRHSDIRYIFFFYYYEIALQVSVSIVISQTSNGIVIIQLVY